MNFSLKKILSLLSLSVFFITACSQSESGIQKDNAAQTNSGQNAEKTSESFVKDDVEELEKTIRLPFTPEEATWREDSANAPNGKKLTAVVRFSTEDSNAVSRAANNKPATAADIDAETWFPAELIAQSQLSGDESLKGVSVAADDFVQTPYKQGKITRIDGTNYFVLELSGD